MRTPLVALVIAAALARSGAAIAQTTSEIHSPGVGLQAPAIAGTPRNAPGDITLESFRGKPIVIVFWGST